MKSKLQKVSLLSCFIPTISDVCHVPRFCEQAFSLGGVGEGHVVFSNCKSTDNKFKHFKTHQKHLTAQFSSFEKLELYRRCPKYICYTNE